MAHERVAETWERGAPYELYIGRWSRRVAPAFLSWLGVPAGRTWVAVGCGTGALCAAIVDRCSPASVIGVEPSEGFLEALFAGAGLAAIETTPIDIPTPFASFDDYWRPFLGGQGPAPAYAMSLDAARRARLGDRIRELIPTGPDGSIALTARAWAIRGTVAN